ncbi:MAG: DUF2752 domain-containing protein [Saprospiraceae bacterium]|jgi:hypothetical protein|nr:DUF2752 domain-containing protein [Saprospiraceae bacterium]
MTQKSFYRFIIPATLLGCTWILYAVFSAGGMIHAAPTVCLIKATTGVPCPSCGGTRSLMQILHGEWYQALLINPIGYIYFLLVIFIPVWLFWDIVSGRSSLHRTWIKAEQFLRKPPIYIIGILILLANWIWNMAKNI